jgi:hypothetical protein
MKVFFLFARFRSTRTEAAHDVNDSPGSHTLRQLFSPASPAPARTLTSNPLPRTLTKRIMTSPWYPTIAMLTESIRVRQISPVQVLDAHLQRVSALPVNLNAFVHLDAQGARDQARSAEAAVLRNDPLGPLHGIPVTVKSSIDVAGWPCPAGSVLRKDYVPQHDAPLVTRLRAAGAIILGSTNTPEFLMAYETNNAQAAPVAAKRRPSHRAARWAAWAATVAARSAFRHTFLVSAA